MSSRTFWILIFLIAVVVGAVALLADGPFKRPADQHDRPTLTDPNFAG